MKWREYRGWGIGCKIGWSSGKYRLLVQTNLCFVWVCCQYNKSSPEHYGYAVMCICQNEFFQTICFRNHGVSYTLSNRVVEVRLYSVTDHTILQFVSGFCTDIYIFSFLILGVRGTFRWNHAASGKYHKCMRFLQSLIKREVSSASGEGHINSYFSGISSEYREARFVCL